MKKQILTLGVLLSLSLGLSSCGTTEQTLYSWDNYEKLTYNYHKSPDDNLKVKVMKMYDKVINKQKGLRGAIPPGMCTEYGYMLYKMGEKERGMKLLKKEIELYPEAKVYVNRIIKRLQ